MNHNQRINDLTNPQSTRRETGDAVVSPNGNYDEASSNAPLTRVYRAHPDVRSGRALDRVVKHDLTLSTPMWLHTSGNYQSERLAQRLIIQFQSTHTQTDNCVLCGDVSLYVPFVTVVNCADCVSAPVVCPCVHFHINEVCYLLKPKMRALKRLLKLDPQICSKFPRLNPGQMQIQALNLFGVEMHRNEVDGLQQLMHKALDCLIGDEDKLAQSLTARVLTLNSQEDFLAKLVEDVVLFFLDIVRAETVAQRLQALARYVKMRGSGISVSILVTIAMSLIGNLFSQPRMEVQADFNLLDSLKTARSYLDVYPKFKLLPIFKKLYGFAAYMISFGVVERCGIKADVSSFMKLNAEVLKKDYSSSVDFVHCMVDTAVYICTIGVQCFQTKSFSPILYTNASFGDFYDECARLKQLSLHLATLGAHGTDYFTYVHDLHAAIEKGCNIKKFGTCDGLEQKSIAALVNSLQMIDKEMITRKAAMATRKAPLGILLHGASGIGKSQIMWILYAHHCAVRGLNPSKEFCYSRMPGDEFWPNFTSSMHTTIIDDMACMHPTLGLDASVSEMVFLVNNVAHVTNQAKLEDKGKIPFMCELLLATTNTLHLNAHAYYAHPVAVARRLTNITVKLKAQYATAAGRLDESKLPINNGGYMDIWTFTIHEVVSTVDHKPQYPIKHEFGDIYTFLAWFTEHIKHHNLSQEAAMTVADDTVKLPKCALCFLPDAFCSCDVGELVRHQMSVQSDDISPFHFAQQALDSCRSKASVFCKQCENEQNHFCWYEQCEVTFDAVPAYDAASRDMDIFLKQSKFFQVRMKLFAFLVEKGDSSWIWGMILFFLFGHYWRIKIAHKLFSLSEGGSVFVRMAGHRMQHSFGYSSFALKLLLISGSLILVKGLYSIIKNSTNFEESSVVDSGAVLAEAQGTHASSERVPQPTVELKSKPFYRHDPVALTAFEVTATARCGKGDVNSFKARIQRNLAYVKISPTSDGECGLANSMLHVSSSVWVINKHALLDLPFYVSLKRSSSDGVTPNCAGIKVTASMVYVLPDSDIAFLMLRDVPPGKDLLAYFTNGLSKCALEGFYMVRNKHGVVREIKLDNIRDNHDGFETVDSLQRPIIHKRPIWIAKYQSKTELGDCGSPMCAVGDIGVVILGIHVFLQGEIVGALALQRSDVESAMNHFAVRRMSEGTLPISAPSAPRTLTDLHSKSPVMFTQSGTADVVGSFEGFRTKHSSKTRYTTLNPAMVARGYQNKWAPPLMNYMPFYHALQDMTAPAVGFDKDVLKQCREDFVQHILNGLDDTAKAAIHPFDINTAINGVAGVAYCDKMNRQTSMGAPYCKSKKHFMQPIDSPDGCDWMEFSEEVMARRQLAVDTYLSGTRFHAQFCAHLKDQAVTIEKAKIGKTRIFSSMEAAVSLLMRQMFLCIAMSCQNNNFVWGAAVGVVAQSLEWERLYLFVTKFGLNRIIAGDYGKFDKKVPASVMIEAFLVIVQLFEELGYTDDELTIAWGIAIDICFPSTDFGGDFIMFHGTNPSGHPLTVIINCIIGVLYVLYCWKQSAYSHLHFWDHVALMTYGDDMIASVDEACPDFSHTFLSEQLARVGIEFTMADKKTESIPFIGIDQCTFLKRSFVWDADIGAIVAPLEEDSIIRSLMIATPSRTICDKARDVEAIGSAVREYFYYGRDVFEQKVSFLKQLTVECDLQNYIEPNTFPQWINLYDQFWKNSEHVTLKERARVA